MKVPFVLQISILFYFTSFLTLAQNDYPRDIFRAPMDLPIELSGSFSELRQVNFHTGIDIRVVNRTNRNVYAIGDGYLSRIKIEQSGYGNALYITHPEGYVSVYAHLDFFQKSIAVLAKKIQYEQKSFSIDVTFPPDSIRIRKNDIIGIAGNTGFSFGPHLHFEIRDAHTEEIIDPLLFGITVKDVSSPEFRELKIYPHGISTLNGKNAPGILKTTLQKNGLHTISSVPSASGAISFGFDVLDKQNAGNPNRLGLKSITVHIDDSLFLHIQFERLNFKTTRHQLAYIDIPERKVSGKRFQRTWRKPGNQLPIYKLIKDDGILYIKEDKIYNIKCIIEDIGENKAQLHFSLKGTKSQIDNFQVKCGDDQLLFRWDTLNVWTGKYSKVIMDAGTLFSDECIYFYESDSSDATFLGPALHIVNSEEPAGFYKIFFKPSPHTKITSDITIAKSTGKGKYSGLRTNISEEWFEAESRSFGTFLLIRDTLPPQIIPDKIPVNGNVSSLKRLTFKVTDDICGIENYNAYINGEWILLEYDLKSDQMFYIIDEKMPSGNSEFRIIVSDFCGNVGEWKKTLIR